VMHSGIAVDRAIDLQHATVNIRVPGVGISSREVKRSRANLGQRPADAPILATVLNYAGKGGAQVVAAYGQIVGSQKSISVTLNRANRHARRIMTADVKAAVAEKLDPRCATSGTAFKENCSAFAAVRPAVRDQRCRIRGWHVTTEYRFAATCAADRATVVGDDAITRARDMLSILENGEPAARAADRGTIVCNRGIGRSCSIEEVSEAASRSAGCTTVVGKRGIGCS
jgi:hypothetical protein